MRRTKIAPELPSAWVRPSTYAAVVWLILGVAMLGSPPDRLACQLEGSNVNVFALRALRHEAYRPLKGRRLGWGNRELGENELKCGALLSLQGRS
jgi:hypothetical protein